MDTSKFDVKDWPSHLVPVFEFLNGVYDMTPEFMQALDAKRAVGKELCVLVDGTIYYNVVSFDTAKGEVTYYPEFDGHKRVDDHGNYGTFVARGDVVAFIGDKQGIDKKITSHRTARTGEGRHKYNIFEGEYFWLKATLEPMAA